MKTLLFVLLLAAPVSAAPEIVLQTPPARNITALEVLPNGTIAASGEGELNLFSASLQKLATLPDGVAGAPLAFSHDGKRALVGEKSVALCDLPGGAVLWRAQISSFAQHARFVDDDSKIRVVAYGGETLVFDARTGKRLGASRLDSNSSVQTAALSPDGKTLANFYYGSDRGSLRDTQNGKVKAKLAVPDGNVLSARFSPDGALLGAAMMGSFSEKTRGQDDFLRFFNPKTGKICREIRAFGVREFGTRTLSEWNFARDGKLVAASGVTHSPGGKSFSATKIWDVRTGKLLKTLHFSMGALTFSADSQTLFAVRNTRQIAAFNWKTARIMRESSAAKSPRITRFEFAPDGRLVALVEADRDGFSLDSRLHVFDFASSQLQPSLWQAPFYEEVEATVAGSARKLNFQKPLAGAFIDDFAFDAGGNFLATTGATAQIFGWKSGALMKTLPPTPIKNLKGTTADFGMGISKIAVSSDGQKILEARRSAHPTARFSTWRQPAPSQQIWLREGDKSRKIAEKVEVLALKFSPSGQKFAALVRVETGGKEIEGQRPSEVQLRVYDGAGKLLWMAPEQGEFGAKIAWPREDVLLTSSDKGSVQRFKIANGAAETVVSSSEKSMVQTMGAGGHVLLEDREGVQIFDASPPSETEEGAILPLHFGQNRYQFALSGDGKRFAVGNYGGEISIYNAQNGPREGRLSFLPAPHLDQPQ